MNIQRRNIESLALKEGIKIFQAIDFGPMQEDFYRFGFFKLPKNIEEKIIFDAPKDSFLSFASDFVVRKACEVNEKYWNLIFDLSVINLTVHRSTSSLQDSLFDQDITGEEKITFIYFCKQKKNYSSNSFINLDFPTSIEWPTLHSYYPEPGSFVIFPSFLSSHVSINPSFDRYSIMLTGNLLGDRIT